jgi:hypothetical protein
MSTTDGKWEQYTASTDLTLFLGADQFTDFAAVATLPAAPAAGLLFKTVPATDAAKFFVTAEGLLLRSGQFATFGQDAFGTAAAVPGPSLVSGTSGPLAQIVGRPPMTAAQMTTIHGSLAGPPPKGVQINSVDIIYQVLTLAAATATVGLTTTTFSGVASAPVVTNLIALGANGLPTAVAAHPTVTNVVVPTPAMIVPTVDTQVILNINLTAGATGTIDFIGAVLKCSFNFN